VCRVGRARRHRRLPQASTANHQASAAAVCLARYHELPPTALTVDTTRSSRRYELTWAYPSGVERASHGNFDDATRDGAYAVALAAVDARLRLVTVGRAATRTGADWFLRPRGIIELTFDMDADDVRRLEVSGISDDNPSRVRARVNEKVGQARRGRSLHPAIVGVVGFRSARIVVRAV